MRRIGGLAISLLLAGCMTTRISFSDKWNPKSKPSYVDYFDYYWWGLKGSNEVSLQRACVDQKPIGFERSTSLEDLAITAATLGIYAPRTVKIWCGD